jgi:hypothetical protein
LKVPEASVTCEKVPEPHVITIGVFASLVQVIFTKVAFVGVVPVVIDTFGAIES